MKTLTALLIVLFALHLGSCQKDSAYRKIPDAPLVGDWKLAGNYISSGGPQYFVPAKVKTTATFNSDGSLTGTTFPAYHRYTLVDSTTIKLTGTGTDYTTYAYKIHEDTLRMSPVAPYICIEGCSIVFVK